MSQPLTAPSRSHLTAGPAWVWLAGAVLATFVVAGVRIVITPRYFFWDDTQLGAFGQWFGLGSRILSGDVTILDPGVWQGGNFLAEGQWGLLSPAMWLIALGSHAVPSATAYATLVKLAFLALLCVGAYLLAREFGASAPWAAVAGFAVTVGGQTTFFDAPSWVTGLQNVAFFALTWWGLRRHVERGRSPIPFFAFAYLLVTGGYVFGVIELAFLLLFTVGEVWVRRGWRAAVGPFVLGVYSGLLTAVVYLPGILTAPVTSRDGAEIANDQFLGLDLGDLATSILPTAVSSVRGYWGDLAPVPLQYTLWLVPLFLVLGRGFVQHWRTLLPVYAVLGFSLALVLGPSVLGPLRYPARMMPYVVLALVVVFAVLATRSLPGRITRGQRIGVLLVTVGAAWFAWAAQPDSWGAVLIGVVVQLLLFAMIDRTWTRVRPGSVVSVAAVTLVASMAVLAPQALMYRTSPLGEFRVPSSTAQLRSVGSGLESGVMSVGDVYALQRTPEAYSEVLLANLWHTTEHGAANVYTVLPFTTFSEELCLDLRGFTCPEALETLFSENADGSLLVDDLALNSVIVIRGYGLETAPVAPEGWQVQERDHTWLLTRTEPVAEAGGVVRTDGATVSVEHRDDLSVTLRVEEVAADGGRVVFSRLAWPGYSVSGGELGTPERGYLLALDLDATQVGEVITVQFRPPGWAAEVAAAALAPLVAAAWTVFWWVGKRRGRRG